MTENVVFIVYYSFLIGDNSFISSILATFYGNFTAYIAIKTLQYEFAENGFL